MTDAAESKESIFSAEFKAKADKVVARYETRRASSLEILHLVQETYGHITLAAEEEVAAYLKIAPVDVREVMTFYTLYYDKARAKIRFNVCRTLSCSLGGGRQILEYLESRLGIKAGEMTPDGFFSVEAVECLGACELAPMLQLNDDEYIGHLTKDKIDELIQQTPKE